MGGPEMAPPIRPALGPPRGTRGGPRCRTTVYDFAPGGGGGGVPGAAPRAAPAAAPIAVPTAAPVTKLSVAAFLVVMPADWSAHWRQAASSAWNCSKGFPVPGRTITLGPVGMVAQAPSSTASGAARRSDFIASSRGP